MEALNPMAKKGRPKTIKRKQAQRMSLSFSDQAWEILNAVEEGRRSDWVSQLISVYGPHLAFWGKGAYGDGHRRNSGG